MVTTTPTLDLDLSAADKPTRIHLIEIECLMLWPDDPIARAQAKDSMIVDASLAAANAGLLAPDAVLALANLAATTLPRATIDEWRGERMERGRYSGQILFDAISKAVVGQDSSLGRIMSEVKQKYLGCEASTSKAVNTKIWHPFRPVAHFWAAHFCYAIRGIDAFPCERSRMALFLAIADDFRKRGESLKLKPKAPATILPPGQTVLLPTGLNLPHGRMIFENIH